MWRGGLCRGDGHACVESVSVSVVGISISIDQHPAT